MHAVFANCPLTNTITSQQKIAFEIASAARNDAAMKSIKLCFTTLLLMSGILLAAEPLTGDRVATKDGGLVIHPINQPSLPG